MRIPLKTVKIKSRVMSRCLFKAKMDCGHFFSGGLIAGLSFVDSDH